MIRISRNRLEYLIAFFIASSYTFSNVKVLSVDLNNIFAVITFLISLFILDYRSIIGTIFISLIIFFSTLNSVFHLEYWVTFIYKMLTTYPILILVNGRCYKQAYTAALHSFIISNVIAIAYLIINQGTQHKFIIYFDVIPRYAALAKEPVSFAFFSLGVYILYFFIDNKFNLKRTLFWYIPILFAVSGMIVVKVLADVLWKFKKAIYYYWIILIVPLSLVGYLLWVNTRISASLTVRVAQYFRILESIDFVFFGSGFYLAKGFIAGLPGLFRVYFELGIIFCLCLAVVVIFNVYARQLWKYPILLLAILLPFLTEAYGAQFVWMIFGFAFTYHKRIIFEDNMKPVVLK